MKYLIRTLLKYKSYTIINVIGLSIGIACALVLFLIIDKITSIDNYHEKKDRIYRVVTLSKNNGNDDYNSGVPVPLIEALTEEFPELEVAAPVYYVASGRISIGEGESSKVYEENEGIVYCDNRLYKILDRAWVRGNKEISLTEPNEVVLSQSWARKYFGSVDILGESIRMDDVGELVVTGVMEDFPEGRTDFPFEMLISYKTIERTLLDQGGWTSTSSNFQCYLLIHYGENIQKLEERLPAFADKYYGTDRRDNRHHEFQPLNDLHFDEKFSNFRNKTINKINLLIMGILGVFIVTIACINFVNLSTVQATRRFREVGVRKVLGSTRKSITFRFLGETAIISCLALIIALGLAELSLFKVNRFLELDLSINLTGSIKLWIFLISIFAFVTFGAGLYPGLLLSRFQPSTTIKGGNKIRKGGWRKGLVVFQFFVSQFLIIGTLIILSQLSYYKNSSVGFEKEDIVNVSLPKSDVSKMEVFKNSLLQIPGISDVSLAWGPPAWGRTSTTNAIYEYKNQQEELDTQVKMCDEDYLKVFGLNLVAGDGLVPTDSANRGVINETFAKMMGYQDPDMALGKTVNLWGKDLPISGVVADFHTTSFRNKIEPVILYSDLSRYEMAAVKLRLSNITESLKRIEQTFVRVYPGYSYNYSFMDETFANFYRGEEKMSKMLMTFSGIAIFIGCMGLFGMVSFLANNRTKEIGIRKILGASVGSILFSFSKEFVLLIFMAFILSAPVVYFGMDSWLSQFAYHINPGVAEFLLGTSFTLVIALGTIAHQSIKASLTNPVDVLKEE